MTKEEMARAYADGYNKEYQQIAYDAFLCGYRDGFIAGAEWQKKLDQKTIELAEDHAMLAGMNKMEQQMMEKAVEGTVCKDESDVWIEIRPDALPNFKDMQPVKLIVKEDVE